jgi:beta-lactamase class A
MVFKPLGPIVKATFSIWISFFWGMWLCGSVGAEIPSILETATPSAAPAAPLNLQAYPDERDIVVMWDAGAREASRGFHVYARPAAGGTWRRLTDEPLDYPLYRHRNLNRGDVWEYRVTAVGLDGTESRFPDGGWGGGGVPKGLKVPPGASLQGTLDALAQQAPARVGVYCYHVERGEEASVLPDEQFPAMSGIKSALAAAVLARDLENPGFLDTTLTLNSDNQVGGSGVLYRRKSGSQIPLRAALRYLLQESDNTAANTILDEMGGVRALSERLEKMGFSELKVLKKALKNGGSPYPDLSARFDFSVITPRSLGMLFRRLDAQTLVSPRHDTQLRDLLTTSQPGGRIKKYLTDRAGVKVANKTGSADHHRLDSGIVSTPDRGHWILVVALKDYPTVRWDSPHPCDEFIALTSWELYNYFGRSTSDREPEASSSAVRQTSSRGAHGALLHSLEPQD